MKKVNWDNIQESTGFDNPKPGGYYAVITRVEDVEEKEYLRIEWDFDTGPYKNYNSDTFQRAGFWPTVLIRSYKDSALPYFKGFKTVLEQSNRGYTFQEDRLQDMVGKYIGVVLGEEVYINNRGEHKTRLYVAETKSCAAIKQGYYNVPELREARQRNAASAPVNTAPIELSDEDDLPF